MKIKLLCFAAMKEYFPAEQELQLENTFSSSDLRLHLGKLNPKARSLLKISRFAINQTIFPDDQPLFENAIVAILPPSSGG